jgi:hypothetical protein
MYQFHRIILGTTVLACAVMPGFAQERPSTSMMPGSSMPMMQRQGQSGGTPMAGMMGMMNLADHAEGRIAFLKAELKISDDQLPQWNNFADAVRGNARHMADMRSTMMQPGSGSEGNSLHAPDRLDRVEKMLAAMLESVRSVKAVLGPLYAALSDEQKKSADALLSGPMGMIR